MNLQAKFSEAETFFAQGYYAQAVNACGQVLEGLLRHLYHRILTTLSPQETQDLAEVLQRVGRGRRVDELTLGQLEGLFRQANLHRRLERALGGQIQGLEQVRTYIDLRNQATHRGAQIERESAEAFLSLTRWLLRQLEDLERPARWEISALPPWSQVVQPHRDIREGRFDPEVFAAKLDDVLAGRGPLEYRDPQAFFRHTYPAAGLCRLVQSVVRRLSGQGGEAVIRLETPFGGGKTHALLALYHLLGNRDQVLGLEAARQLLGDIPPEEVPAARVAVFVGTEADALAGRTPWGELAAQLGAYDLVREHDRQRVSPGKAVLRQVLESPGEPVLLLVDELAQYLVRTTGVPSAVENLRRQTLAFLQELTEVVTTLPQVSLVLTLPASVLEFHDEQLAEEILARLRHVTGRVEAIYTPVEGEMETYEVIRRRLFEEPDDPTAYRRAVDQIVEAYSAMYRSLGEDVPAQAREPAYRERMARAYPFHPELIDILLERWSTFKSFQRTRGVLRLLALVIHDLYARGDTASLIQPASLNLENRAIREEFLKHIGPQFEGVIASDIADRTARAGLLDREMGPEYRRYRVSTALATAIFFYSFSSGGALQGVGVPRLRLAFLHPQVPAAIVGDALGRLQDTLWYLHREESRFYFSIHPNLNRVLIEHMDDVQEDDIVEEVRRQVKGITGTALAVYPFPRSSRDLPDNRTLKLAVLSPQHLWGASETETLLREFLNRCGEGHRVNKNTLLFLLMDQGTWLDLMGRLRRWLALRAIRENRDLMARFSEADRKEVERRYKETEVGFLILSAYRILVRGARDGFQTWDLGMATVGEKSLADRVRSFLETEEVLLRALSPRYVQERLLGDHDKLDYAAAAASFFTVPGNPILESEAVLKRAIADGVRGRFFGLRVGEQVYFDEGIPDALVGNEARIIQPDTAQEWKAAQRPPELPAEERRPVGHEVRETPEAAVQPEAGETAPEGHQIRIVARVGWDRLSDFVSGVVSPLHHAGAEVSLKVELTAQSQERINPTVLDLQVRETLQQIGAEVETFEGG
jgi:hypothetical protein